MTIKNGDEAFLTSVLLRLVVAKGKAGWERDGVGVWDQQMQTSVYRMDK